MRRCTGTVINKSLCAAHWLSPRSGLAAGSVPFTRTPLRCHGGHSHGSASDVRRHARAVPLRKSCAAFRAHFSGPSKHSPLIAVTRESLAVNCLLVVAKASVATWTGSLILVADTMHTLGDVASQLTLLMCLRAMRRKADANHPYGHGKLESVGTFVIGFLLLFTAYHLFVAAVDMTRSKTTPAEHSDSAHSHDHSCRAHMHGIGGLDSDISSAVLGVSVAVLAIASKLFLFRRCQRVGQQNNSRVVIANGYHQLADALASTVAFVGLISTALGVPFAEPVAAAAIAALVARSGGSLCIDSVGELMDAGASEHVWGHVVGAVARLDGLVLQSVKTRQTAQGIIMELEVELSEGWERTVAAFALSPESAGATPLVSASLREPTLAELDCITAAVREAVFTELPSALDLVVIVREADATSREVAATAA